MYKENISILYDQYRACIEQDVIAHEDREDIYNNYLIKCIEQRKDIEDYYMKNFEKTFNLKRNLHEHEVLQNIEGSKNKLFQHGWNEKQIRN